jgi:serine/threonine protein kinase
MAKTFGERWQVEKPLSEGGQGHTFLVRDLKGDPAQKFVLKRLKNLNRLGRFKQEVAAMLKLDHRDILKVVDHSFAGTEPFLVSEFCDGGTLESSVERRLPRLDDAFRWFIYIADAVNHAHSQGVIHRDLKPANIFLRSPTFIPLVGDFGLCYLEETAKERHTEVSEAVGPRFFMAPELEDGRAEVIAPSADIYSLGKMLYWLLTGRVFSREKFRDDRWNLGNKVPHQFEPGFNLQMEHINRLLDQMVVEDPKKRAPLSEVIPSAHRIRGLISRAINPVTGKSPMNCTFCGWGQYRVIHSGTEIYNFGLQQVGSPDWRILACSECGHIQMFRLDYAKRDNWWAR